MRPAVCALALVLLRSVALGQPLPGCQAAPDVRQILREKLNPKELDQLTFADRMAREHAVLEDLIAKHPRELEPHQRLMELVQNNERDRWPELRAHYRQMAQQNADDPLSLYLGGLALEGYDTPESIRLLESAHAKAAGFGWPSLELAKLYGSGKRIDKSKSASYLESFYSACPYSTERIAQWYLRVSGTPALQAHVASELRAHLAGETDPEELKLYQTLWGTEFRTRPPNQHAELRKQVAADLKRLESLNPKPDSAWLGFLKNGYKQSGETAAVAAIDDRILKDFPSSKEASDVAYDRWIKAHKEPEDQNDSAAWAAWDKEYRAALKGWIHQFTGSTWLQRSAWFYEISEDPAIPEKEGIASMEQYLKSSEDYNAPSYSTYLGAAEFLIDHKWQPKRALDLLHRAQPLMDKAQAREKEDNLSQEDEDSLDRSRIFAQQELAGQFLLAARLAGKPAEVQPLRAIVEGPAPTVKKRESDYWLNRARLAVLDGRKADALAYYQQALQTRVSPPAPWHGRLQDNLTDEARALWKDTGGTEVAWELWIKPPAAKAQELTEGRWEKPTKTIPGFELADLSGKTWKLGTLEGKSVLINLWATWCGPCKTELPHLQKLYESVKDRSDLQIITFNMDEDLGLVEPFMKEKGYTFPVLPALSMVNGLFPDGWGIPQNWILDPKGVWRWTQIGFGGLPDWEEDMVRRLEGVKKGE